MFREQVLDPRHSLSRQLLAVTAKFYPCVEILQSSLNVLIIRITLKYQFPVLSPGELMQQVWWDPTIWVFNGRGRDSYGQEGRGEPMI